MRVHGQQILIHDFLQVVVFVVSYLLVDVCGDSFFREPEVATATNRQFLQMLQETAERDPEDFVKSL